MTEGSITGTGFDCSFGVHITNGDSPRCIICGVDTSAKPDIAVEKIVQITAATNGVFALTNKGRLFLRMGVKWFAIDPPNFKE